MSCDFPINVRRAVFENGDAASGATAKIATSDDFMRVTVILEFAAKNSPNSDDLPVDIPTELSLTLPAAEAAEYLNQVADAAAERRLFGFMQQEIADCHVSSGEWIENNDLPTTQPEET